MFEGLGNLIEKIGSVYIQGETLKAQQDTYGNTGSDYQYFETGENHDGSTIVSGRLIAGVSNAALLGGVAVLAGLAVMAWVVIKD